MNKSKANAALDMIKKAGIIRSKDMKGNGMHREYLRRLSVMGDITKIGRGLYRVKDTEITEHHNLVEACTKVQRGVICLLSALYFHDLTTQLPFEVWIAIDNKARKPVERDFSMRVVRFSGGALTGGIEEHFVEGVRIRVYSPAKTVADCFKFRNKIGLDVALEALRECWSKKLCTMDDLWESARVCRVSNIMRPYLETLG